jgi:hypothetical protein
MVASIVGWVILIASWVVPTLYEDKTKGQRIGFNLALLSSGIFIGALLYHFFK